MWQRFTERARRVILLGQEEAAKMHSGYVGTEHLLLGLMREDEGVGAQVLHKMGITLEQLQQEVKAGAEPNVETSNKEPRLTPRSKQVLELAADESRRMQHNYIGTEHLLLALLREKDGLAARVLHNVGLESEKTRDLVMEYLGPEATGGAKTGRVKTRAHGEFNVTPQFQALLEAAAAEAEQWGHKRLDTTHLMLALLHDEDWASILPELGLDLALARERIRALLFLRQSWNQQSSE